MTVTRLIGVSYCSVELTGVPALFLSKCRKAFENNERSRAMDQGKRRNHGHRPRPPTEARRVRHVGGIKEKEGRPQGGESKR